MKIKINNKWYETYKLNDLIKQERKTKRFKNRMKQCLSSAKRGYIGCLTCHGSYYSLVCNKRERVLKIYNNKIRTNLNKGD